MDINEIKLSVPHGTSVIGAQKKPHSTDKDNLGDSVVS